MSKFFIHKTAIVETKNIGEGSTIWAFVHILKNVKIGKNVNICDHCFIEDGVEIGNDVTIKSGVNIWKGVIIKDKVFIGPDVVFSNDKYPRSKNRNFKLKSIYVNEGASIGANTTILPAIKIGKYAMIGAGSVITKNVPDFAIVYGNPAKIMGYICVCGKKLTFKNNHSNCYCGKKYKKNRKKVELIS